MTKDVMVQNTGGEVIGKDFMNFVLGKRLDLLEAMFWKENYNTHCILLAIILTRSTHTLQLIN